MQGELTLFLFQILYIIHTFTYLNLHSQQKEIKMEKYKDFGMGTKTISY